MRLKRKFVHTDTHMGGKKSTYRRPTHVTHTCAVNTHTHMHSRVAKAANKHDASGCFSVPQLEPRIHATASFFFEQHFFFFFFYTGANHPFHAGTCKPAGFARTISHYFENEVVQIIVFIVASAPTESSVLTAARGSRGGCKCFHNMWECRRISYEAVCWD